MKLSISVSEQDVAHLDEYARSAGLRSRSAAVQQAIRHLSHEGLGQDYAAAWEEWGTSGDREAWEGAVGDGLGVGSIGGDDIGRDGVGDAAR